MLTKSVSRKSLLALAIAPALLGLTALQAQAQTDVSQKVSALEAQLNQLKADLAKEKDATTTKGVETKKGTRFQFGGFIKLDAMYSDYSDGDRATASIGDDFYIPSTLPIGGESGSKFDMHAKQSRFHVKSTTDTDAGQVNGLIEIDFQLSGQGDERISNSYAPRIRHAYLSWDYSETTSLLAGQTWSTLFNVSALPNTVDFVGPAGTIFVRQAQLRWSKKLSGGNAFHFALENPSTGLNGGSNNYDNNELPDVAIRFDGKANSFTYSLAGIGREIHYKDTIGGQAMDESEFGYALSGSAVWKFGADDFKVMLNYGNAIGRYMGLQSFRDGSIAPDGAIELNDQIGGFITYKHAWNDQWRSSLVLSASRSDNPDFVAASTPSEYQSAHINLIYSPAPAINLGAEFIYGEKTIENDDSGSMNRLQFMAMYSF
ncbi:DcaP family trimeric outer membrane transporter [Simiduia curdlanivorans]|uniref:DcaP family trimeric outer membrane transporter n=1 Tax=Simiduia curdlanivorans TaxID=1492769 RepID=A0ABV8V478_9GAMM|nr:DcaP family trimeric outer membrane transporter [Simiduia curdlanivorans]MDN3640046.1 DcaP family trimeric outer membrane transporter [Simiduia curdlanivorans]